MTSIRERCMWTYIFEFDVTNFIVHIVSVISRRFVEYGYPWKLVQKIDSTNVFLTFDQTERMSMMGLCVVSLIWIENKCTVARNVLSREYKKKTFRSTLIKFYILSSRVEFPITTAERWLCWHFHKFSFERDRLTRLNIHFHQNPWSSQFQRKRCYSDR